MELQNQKTINNDGLLSLQNWSAKYIDSYFTYKQSRFHQWLVNRLDTMHLERGVRLNVLAPRGSAKSTWASFAYPLRAALHGHEQYIILTSDTGEQAKKYLDSIRTELETNELLRQAYPGLAGKGSVWRDDRIKLANGVMIEAMGTGTKLRGRKNRQHRPTLIIVDDPQNTNHMLSVLQRDRSWDWLVRDVCNAGGPTTNIVVLGTALHRDCIVCKLQRTPGWKSHLFQSVEQWPERMDLWQEWENVLHQHDDADKETKAELFYLKRKQEMEAGSQVLWPARESLLDLMKLRASIGPASFESEKQNNPINPELCEWPESHFDRPGFWFEDWPINLTIKSIGLDPSKGRDSKVGDYYALVKLGRDKSGVLYCEAELGRKTTEHIIDQAIEVNRDFRPDVFAIETNVYQELLATQLTTKAVRSGMPVPVKGVVNTLNKAVRIRRLGAYLAQGIIRFKANSPGTQMLVQQLRDFPIGDHDDGPDGLELALREMIELANERHKAGQRK